MVKDILVINVLIECGVNVNFLNLRGEIFLYDVFGWIDMDLLEVMRILILLGVLVNI